MKKLAYLIIFAIAFTACNFETHKHEGHDHDGHEHEGHEHEKTEELPSTGNFGEEITEEGSVAMDEIPGILVNRDSVEIKLEGEILTVCQHSGCWMDVDLGNGEEMKVTFKDYGFFVPKDAAGKTTIVEGVAQRELIPVDMLRHYAEDAGKTKEEIEAITEPEWSYTFVANGVIIK